jgi:hypothetical protein
MAFIDRYVTLKEYADGLGRPFKHVKADLDARGIDPVSPKPIMGRLLYRRSDL